MIAALYKIAMVATIALTISAILLLSDTPQPVNYSNHVVYSCRGQDTITYNYIVEGMTFSDLDTDKKFKINDCQPINAPMIEWGHDGN